MANPEDPEQYIRRLEHGGSPTPGKSGGATGGPHVLEALQQRLAGIAKLAGTVRGRLILIGATVAVIALLMLLTHYAGQTTVHGNLVMLNSGANDTIDCNNGNVKLDGSNNTYTIHGHCRRLEIFGGANHVAVDSADTISIFGDDNAVIYHSGAPSISRTGNNNTVASRADAR